MRQTITHATKKLSIVSYLGKDTDFRHVSHVRLD